MLLFCLLQCFDCQKKEELKVVSAQRFTSIVNASKALNDDLYKTLSHADQSNSIQLYCHKTCVSLYTSKEHIKRALQQKGIVAETVNPGSTKRTRSSLTDSLFDFKKHCIFCGTECFEKDPKKPTRWRFIIKWGQLLEQSKVYLSKIIQVYTFYKSVLCGKIASLNILLFTCNGRKLPSRLQESLFPWWTPLFHSMIESKEKRLRSHGCYKNNGWRQKCILEKL